MNTVDRGSSMFDLFEGHADLRKEDRVPLALSFNMADTPAITHDISPSGICFETNSSFKLGDRVDFSLEFGKHGGNLTLKCQGEIIRVNNRKDKVTVAVKIVDSTLQPA